MKELSIEQKARRYDEALQYARIYYKNGNEDMKMMMKTCFPVLVEESEDEKIRSAIINEISLLEKECVIDEQKAVYKSWISWLEKQGEHANFINKIQIGDKVTRNEDGVLVNLSQLKRVAKSSDDIDTEKQGEQKHVDKVEPKFKIGDFIVNDYCMGRIVEITNDAYLLDTEQGIPFSSHSTRLWDITKDAKDGDVLINWNNTAFIFKSIEDETVKFHIAYNEKWDAIKTPSTKLSHLGLPEPQFEFHPSTKEQRGILFQKMKEDGYEWDAKKKELKKIEQKPAWSEEDEKLINSVIELIDNGALDRDEKDYFIGKLNSLKDRVLPKQEWSEEDEKTLNDIITSMTNLKDSATSDALRDIYNSKVGWLKSLRPQNKWKPSDEQMEALLYEVNAWDEDSVNGQNLISRLKEAKRIKL